MGIKRIIPFLSGALLPPVTVFLFLPGYFVHLVSQPSTPTNSPTPSPRATPSPTASPSPTRKPLPSKTPAPTITPITSEALDALFTKYSNHYSIERKKLWTVAVCESSLKPRATNGDYAGLYQFSKNTWISTRKAMNENSDPSLRFNPEEAIKTAAFKISTMGLSPWPNCNK